MRAIPHIRLASVHEIPVLGQGTASMGRDVRSRKREIAALNVGIDLGMRLIDTAERYSAGESEHLIGEAIASRRHEVFLVSKVSPENATHRETISACES